jgi:excisionase family DNA binding protein
MSTQKRRLSPDQIKDGFIDKGGEAFPIILSPERLAALLGLSVKTIYQWIAQGRLNGSFRRRGKHVLIWRDRAIEILFNGNDWSTSDE